MTILAEPSATRKGSIDTFQASSPDGLDEQAIASRVSADTQLAQYYGCIYDPSDIIEVRKLSSGEDPTVHKEWYAAHELPTLAERFQNHNGAGWNLIIGVNPRPKAGASKDKSIRIARNVFVDLDDTTVDEAMRKVSEAGLPSPTLVISSGHGVHIYWRLTARIEDMAAWSEWQLDAAVMLSGDKKCRNPERLMRLPGFANLKREPHVPCMVVNCDASKRTDFGVLRSIVVPRPKPTFTVTPIRINRGISTDNAKRCRAYISKCRDAREGERGHDATFLAACECVRFDLTESEAWDTMLWFNETKCFPEWTEMQLKHKLDQAEKVAGAYRGFRLNEQSNRKQATRQGVAA